MSEIRIIKKYPNRRLYDCLESRYITLQDLHRLAIENIEFKVIEKMSGKDLTSSVLLQIVSDQEQGSEALLGQEFLLQLIRSYGGSMTKAVRGYLDQSLKTLIGPDFITDMADDAARCESAQSP
jgi:polyhydroxyalkanoate synthesis repressor PhaR